MSKKRKSIYNLANFLSISRIFAAIPLIVCFENFDKGVNYYYYSILIIVFIVLSDILDGYFARLSNCVTDFGKLIDPIADKTCLLVVLIYLIDEYQGGSYAFNPFLLFYIILAFRDITLILFSLYNISHREYVSQANNSGKFFIFCSSIMIVFYIYNIDQLVVQIFYILSLFFMIFSMYTYIKDHNAVRKK